MIVVIVVVVIVVVIASYCVVWDPYLYPVKKPGKPSVFQICLMPPTMLGTTPACSREMEGGGGEGGGGEGGGG